ncbi:MAG: LamG-like jellyroll fold domain-containing protein [Gammaproteobacteria bacterium]
MTSSLRIASLCLLAALLTVTASAQDALSIGANVNMVSGGSFPDGDPFQRQQNEPSVAFSSRNNLHLLAGANDYRAVDVPGLPGGGETGDSWLSYFWSTNGGASWKSTLIPGYPQDPACQTNNAPTLCGYAAGADPVVRAGVNGMFYYSGIVFERSDPSRSAIFVSRFIDLNNDEGGDPIRYLDTTIIDANNDGDVFLDKSWIGVDIPRDTITDDLIVTQRDGSTVNQTVSCGNIYVGYAAIGGEDQDLRSEIRMATSADCGNSWDIQVISEPDSLNQGANIAIHPLTGDVHVAWRRFDTVESFLGISPTGCPARARYWGDNSDWPTSSIQLGGDTYTIAEAQHLLRTKHRGDESIKLVKRVIAAKLNILTGGGDPVEGFNASQWSQELSGLIAEADAWFMEHPIGSRPRGSDKRDARVLKMAIQRITLGSGSCEVNSGSPAGTTGDTNAIMIASSDDLGETFGDPAVVDESSTFDQGSTTFSFRTTAYPTVAADADGRVYVAWAARGFATIRDEISDGDARIVLSTSTDGTIWTDPYAIDEPNREGHQIKPSILFAGGQLTLVFYDFRQDVSNIFESFVVDLPDGDRLRHTVDVRVATAVPGIAPAFTDYSLTTGTDEPVNPSSSASRYNFLALDNGAGGETLQVEYMVPNFPMFADGTTPFIGDYVDVAAPNFINDGGTWRFASNPGDVQVWQAVWSDNRDVIPPPDGDWSKYVTPITQAQPSLFDPTVTIPSCEDVTFPDALPEFQAGSLYTGTRNQNVYSASISKGVIVAAPGNNRPLGLDDTGAPLERGFVVYVQNTTGQARAFRLSLPATPIGVEASFAPNISVTQTDIDIPPYSSAVATVFASSNGAGVGAAIPVSVAEIGGALAGSILLNSDAGAPDPLNSTLLTQEVHNPAILNPAILNPAIFNATVTSDQLMSCGEDMDKCVLNPAIMNPAIFNPAILNPAIFNPAILNPAIFNPAILNPAIFNPAIFNPAILNPAIMNPAILNPAILNPAIFNPAIFNPAILNPAILNPAIMNPAILNPAILNPAILNPAIFNPAILNPAILNPAILNTTPGVEPQQVDVTFSIQNEGNATTAYDLNLAAPQLEGLDYELIVYRLNETPVAQGCTLTTEAQQQLIFSQTDPLNNGLDGSFYLEPGQEVLVTFSVRPDPDADVPADPATTFDVADLGGLISAQPLNTDPATQPPADSFGEPANIVAATAGGTVVGAGGTPPVNAGTLTLGEQVSVTASGFVTLGDVTLFEPETPDGSGVACDAACLLPGAPTASLVARIGGGPWQLVGSGPTTLTATSAGDLEFAVNDNGYNDNTGAFYVSVTPVSLNVIADLTNWWPGEGNAIDVVGTNDGILFGGATFGTGLVNQSFVFDGADDYMDIGQPLPTSAGTVDFWVRRNGAITSGSDVFFGATGPNLQRTPTLFVRGGGTLVWEFNNITFQDTGAPINVGQWYHLAMTWDFTGGASDVEVWVDGVMVDSFTGVSEPTDFQASVLVGAYQDVATVNQFANASIDEIDVFNRALTAAEIQSIFDAGAAGKLRTRFTVTSFDPSVVFSGTGPAEQAALDAAVGITGYTIEDFEDLTLIPGLTTAGGAFGLNIAGTFTGALWDGANYYVDQVLTGGGVTFNVAGGTSSFGIGLGDIDIPTVNLFVNGEDLGAIRDLPNWVKLGDNVRDVYIRIDAAEGESITSVDVRQLTGTFSDGVFFDHLAIAP